MNAAHLGCGVPIRSWASRSFALVLVLVVAVTLVPLPETAGAASGDPEIERLHGPDRYATSLAVARRFAHEEGGTLDSAVLVAGTSWTDAVVAAGLAGSLEAPVLLASPDGLSADALTFLADTGVSRVVAIAAAGTFTYDALLSALESLPSSVTDTELIIGSDASGTSVAVARRIGSPGVMPSDGRTVIVANSTVFADALVAGPFAARGAHPVLLTPRDTLHSDVASYIRTQGVEHVVIMGGTAAISAGVQRELASLGPQITRLAGATRFESAAAAADFVQAKYSSTVPRCFDRTTAGLATAHVPFDSFSAAPLLARLCAPLLLTGRDQFHPATAQWLRTSTEHIVVLGGTAAISQTAINAYLNTNEPAPDLVVGIPMVDVSAPVAGTRFTLSATVRNQGSGRSASTTLRYYRSADPTITTADTEAGTDTVYRLYTQGSEAESISVTAPPTPGTYYYGACADTVSGESDTANNCSPALAVTVGAAPAPDLIVDTPTVDVSAPVAGTRFTLSATVRNQGSGRSVSTTLRYYRSADPTITTADTEADTDSVTALDAQGSEAESISLTAPSTPGTYYYGACADTVSGESDTANNCSPALAVTVGAAPAPDLIVDTPTVDVSAPVAGARFTLSATVRNQGNALSASTTLRYYRSADPTITTADTPAGTDTVSKLNAQESGAESTSQTAPSTPGTYYYGACVGWVSGESDKTNNCSAAVSVTVGAAPAPDPDLVVDTPTVSDSSPTAGSRFTLSATVRNQGNGLSLPTTLRYYRSADTTITTGDMEVGYSDYVSLLHAQGGGAESTSVTAPSTSGTYYYGACVDSVSDEFNTENNCSPAVTVTATAPDLVVDMPIVKDNRAIAGVTFKITATVSNQGNGASNETYLYYRRSTDATITSSDILLSNSYVGGLNPSGSSAVWSELTAPSTAGTYYYGACVDSVTGESATTNNCSAAVTVTVGVPDLAVDTPTVSDSNPAAGAYFTLTVTVRNLGDATSRWSNLSYYRSTDSTITTGDTEVGTYWVSGLAASANSTERISTQTAPSIAGTYYFGACVPRTVGEKNTTNNCSEAVSVLVTPWTESGPDLVVDTPFHSGIEPAFGAFFTLYATVRNQGVDASGPATLLFYRSTDSTITTSDERIAIGSSISSLSPAETDFLSASSRAPSTSGTYYYGACVVSSWDESNTANNCSPALTLVMGQPDLVVDTPLVNLGSVDASRSFSLNAVVRNQGTGSSPYTILRYYLSTDSTITSEDTSLGSDSVRSVGSSDSVRVLSTQQVPSTAGTYYYGICLDSLPGESSTTNNCSAVVQVTVEPADLAILLPTLFTLNRRPPDAGDEFELRVSVLNRGNLPSVSTTLRYYRSTDATITRSDTPVGTDSVGSLSTHRSSLQGMVLTAPSAAGTYYYGACVDAIGNESTTNNCSEAVKVTVGAVQPTALTLRLMECYIFQNQHFVMFRVTAHVNVSSLVVRTYQIEGRNSAKHLMQSIAVGNLAAGNSYTGLTSKYFPANLRRNLTTCTADVAWDNGTATPDSVLTTTVVPDLPPPDPTDTPVPPADRIPNAGQAYQLFHSLHHNQDALYIPYINCGSSASIPCPWQDHTAWWYALPSYLQRCAFEDCTF